MLHLAQAAAAKLADGLAIGVHAWDGAQNRPQGTYIQ